MTTYHPGPTNTLTDVAGLRVGHASRVGAGWLSGTTVIVAPPEGAVGGVDVRGGGPGTRETDLLDPRNLVDRVHAVVLSGGSAFGLAAADGVMNALADRGVGFPVGDRPGEVVPIVPAAVIFDLGRGGDFACRPGAELGAQAYAAAASGPVAQGCVGAGTGAVAGGLKGGVGSASAVLPGGATVAALVVVNAAGSCVERQTGQLTAVRLGLPGEFPELATASAQDHAAAARQLGSGITLATTIGVVATDLALTKSHCAKVSGIGHDGLARAIRPVHTMVDGDTLFTLATCERGRGTPDFATFQDLLEASADCVTRAVGHAMLAAESVTTETGPIRSYRDVYPSVFPA